MIPRLQQFYGGPPDAWFELRPGVLSAYVQMLPRLDAQQQLRDEQVTLSGSGQMKKDDRTRFVKRLQRMAQTKRRARKANEGDLAALGIKVVKE